MRNPKIVFIGAGSVVFTQGLLADLLAYPELHAARIVLHDIDPERLRVAEAVAHRIAAERGARPEITAEPDRKIALDGADFAINMIQVGGHDATVTDFEIPARYGLRQTIADTIGVGGVFRALRTFPVLDAIAADMAAVCPDALLLNYTNPMAMNVWYLSGKVRNVVGLCHSVYWTMQGLAELVGVPYDEVTYLAAGVNHQAWVLRFERDGENLYDRLDAAVERDAELRRRVRVEMYRRLGHYPTETSEHSAEYVSWLLRHDAEIDRLRIPVGDYVGISAENVREYERTREAVRTGAELPVEGTGEYAPQIIHSMVTGTPRVVYGNVVNDGLISNLPPGCVVEVPCAVDGSGVRPTRVGALPPQLAALNRTYVSVNELTVRAALEGRPEYVRHAVMVDPNASATLSLDAIWRMCDDLTKAHGDLLPPELRTTLVS
ncbi:alpha-glucosidase/alpha-galactosidase [Nonomuraea glycinis]|uniref:Alpha-glucosidase/alpha-galactosidase n=1 Tax=Nonomuraea glycinis TaxID=2047744 RepID=A0A918A0T0_9ACTN|nr:alpha-glucosidase/alpha-galactosidase [Nonomuraea glycinis]MCA2174822.1 alpha-glucosidase/alpha-galactosidase [Nonomuraea glycinis]GGP01591.1 alpha-glucosidase/alpha-galactosidase [Nonomuraea glycinis]